MTNQTLSNKNDTMKTQTVMGLENPNVYASTFRVAIVDYCRGKEGVGEESVVFMPDRRFSNREFSRFLLKWFSWMEEAHCTVAEMRYDPVSYQVYDGETCFIVGIDSDELTEPEIGREIECLREVILHFDTQNKERKVR